MKKRRIVITTKDGVTINSLITPFKNQVSVEGLHFFENDKFEKIHKKPLESNDDELEKNMYDADLYKSLPKNRKEEYRTFIVDSNDHSVMDNIKNNCYNSKEEIESFYEDGYITFSSNPTDPEFILHQHDIFEKMGIVRVWDFTQGRKVIVAVIDTGVFIEHIDLKQNLWNLNGKFGFTEKDILMNDGLSDGHGTQVSGIIASLINNQGVVGIAPFSTLQMHKLDLSGDEAFMTSASQAMIRAKKEGAKIINCSFGVSRIFRAETSEIKFQECINNLSNDVLFVFASGNGDANGIGFNIQKTFLNELNGVIVVGALNNIDESLAKYSNFGNNVVYAYGEMRSTSKDGGYVTFTHTSAAAPQVSGVCALLMGASPNAKPVDIKNAIESTTTLLDANLNIRRVNAFAAFQMLNGIT